MAPRSYSGSEAKQGRWACKESHVANQDVCSRTPHRQDRSPRSTKTPRELLSIVDLDVSYGGVYLSCQKEQLSPDGPDCLLIYLIDILSELI